MLRTAIVAGVAAVALAGVGMVDVAAARGGGGGGGHGGGDARWLVTYADLLTLLMVLSEGIHHASFHPRIFSVL